MLVSSLSFLSLAGQSSSLTAVPKNNRINSRTLRNIFSGYNFIINEFSHHKIKNLSCLFLLLCHQLNAIFLIYINNFIYRAVDKILKIGVNSK